MSTGLRDYLDVCALTLFFKLSNIGPQIALKEIKFV